MQSPTPMNPATLASRSRWTSAGEDGGGMGWDGMEWEGSQQFPLSVAVAVAITAAVSVAVAVAVR